MADREILGTLVRLAFAEGIRRRVFAVVGALSVLFVVLYGLAANLAFEEVSVLDAVALIEERTIVGATMTGLAMFATLFLAAVLVTFMTMGAIRGHADAGLLAPIAVRPVPRSALLIAPWLAATIVGGAYVLTLFASITVLTWALGGWVPDRPILAGLALVGAVAVLAALSVSLSVWLRASATGIAVLMVYGAGLTAGLLGQIGQGLNIDRLERAGEVVAWALPFEALYQAALSALTADTGGLTGLALSLGPFGGPQSAGPELGVWAVVYIAAVLALASRFLRRSDL
ncbi:MAG: hypothetical protein ACR2NA_08710 [Solirubrobacterales bacterium]